MEFCGTLLMEVSSALLRGIWRTFPIASLTKRCLCPLFIRCVVSALERVLKNSSFEQILLSRKASAEGNGLFSVRWVAG